MPRVSFGAGAFSRPQPDANLRSLQQGVFLTSSAAAVDNIDIPMAAEKRDQPEEYQENMMTREKARRDVLRKLHDYATGRKSDVARGAESPHLAGLLLQKYGYGLCDAFEAIFGSRTGPEPTYSDVDRAVAEIDPEWSANAKKRWAGRPATIADHSSDEPDFAIQ